MPGKARRYRLPSALTTLSSVRLMTRVGTRIVEMMSLMSIRWFIRAYAAAPAGLLDTRSFLPHQRLNAESVMREGAYIATLPPLPQ